MLRHGYERRRAGVHNMFDCEEHVQNMTPWQAQLEEAGLPWVVPELHPWPPLLQ
jgi:hypothetical protein